MQWKNQSVTWKRNNNKFDYRFSTAYLKEEEEEEDQFGPFSDNFGYFEFPPFKRCKINNFKISYINYIIDKQFIS